MVDVSNFSELDDMRNDLTADYVLTSDIDASSTQTSNQTDQFTYEFGLSSGTSTGTYYLYYPIDSIQSVIDNSDNSSLAHSIENGDDALMSLDESSDGTVTVEFTGQSTISQGFEPIGSRDDPFTGTFDGNGFTITGLQIDRRTRGTVGLFGEISNSGTLINDLTLENVDMHGGDTFGAIVGLSNSSFLNCRVTGQLNPDGATCGGVVGFWYGNGVNMQECISEVDISGQSGLIGGLAGYSDADEIFNCYNIGSITADGPTAGGIIGTIGAMIDPGVHDCFVDASISVNDSSSGVGGIAGSDDGTESIETSYFANTVDGSPIIGSLGSGSEVIDCYWDETVSGISSGNGTPLSTSEMQGSSAEANMDGFNFSTVWHDRSGDYPIQLVFVDNYFVHQLVENSGITGKTSRPKIESFEHDNLGGIYSGSASYFDIESEGDSFLSPFDGNNYLRCLESSSTLRLIRSTNGLDRYPSAGESFAYSVRLDFSSDLRLVFACQSETDSLNLYTIGTNRNAGSLIIEVYIDGSRDSIDSVSVDYPSFEASEYDVTCDWQENGDITATLYDFGTNNQVAQVSTNSTEFTEGGIGFIHTSESGDDVFDNIRYDVDQPKLVMDVTKNNKEVSRLVGDNIARMPSQLTTVMLNEVQSMVESQDTTRQKLRILRETMKVGGE